MSSRRAHGDLDLAVVGGGILGLAVAWTMQRRHPGARVAVLEKEAELGFHQTGHNSGVLHSGIYYPPGSLKARTCRAGRAAMEKFCEEEGLPLLRTGKLIVAGEKEELPRLEQLFQRGQANGVDCARVEGGEMRELEPHSVGLGAIHVRETAVVDFRAVALRLSERIRERGGEVHTSAEVQRIEPRGERSLLRTARLELWARRVVSCAGLWADRVARRCGEKPPVRVLPFRGEYRLLRPQAAGLVRALIYPVPDPRFPFLGVHLTRGLDGKVKCGPSAVPAFSRAGYRRRDIRPLDLLDSLAFRGARRFFLRHWRLGASELWRAASERAFLRQVRRLVPEIQAGDLLPGPSGVRAQAVDAAGHLVEDFVLHQSGKVLHLLNAPSPAATAALAIAEEVVSRLEGGLE